jgi:putative intracellular protease/amidase
LGDTGKKTGFGVEEFAAPYYALADAGADITARGQTGGVYVETDGLLITGQNPASSAEAAKILLNC